MASSPESSLDRLWREYGAVFREFDDLSLGRWMSQTLGQISGRTWRLSHPLIGAYRLAAQLGHERQIWLKRISTPPSVYPEASCCRAPLLPLLTRDVLESGLICQHCNETAIAFEDLPSELHRELKEWAENYSTAHKVAHWDEAQQARCGDYDEAFEDAASDAEELLFQAGSVLAVKLLDSYPTILWEDQDECLEVRPEDIEMQ